MPGSLRNASELGGIACRNTIREVGRVPCLMSRHKNFLSFVVWYRSVKLGSPTLLWCHEHAPQTAALSATLNGLAESTCAGVQSGSARKADPAKDGDTCMGLGSNPSYPIYF